MYYDGFFLGRADTVDRIIRWTQKGMEGVWHGDPNLGDPADIFYSIFFIAYGAPFGLSNDQGSSAPPVQVCYQSPTSGHLHKYFDHISDVF